MKTRVFSTWSLGLVLIVLTLAVGCLQQAANSPEISKSTKEAGTEPDASTQTTADEDLALAEPTPEAEPSDAPTAYPPLAGTGLAQSGSAPPVYYGTESYPPPEAADGTYSAFYDALAPYGTWVDVQGYGRCWQPTAVVVDPSWRPYCDRG